MSQQIQGDSRLAKLTMFLDGILNLAARAIMILAMLAIVVAVCQLVGFYWLEPEQTRTAKVLAILHSNWRALIILVIPLFYPAIRRFVEEMESIPGLGIRSRPRRAQDLREDVDSS